MSKHIKYATIAERKSGCIWADKFQSWSTVENNGGEPLGDVSINWGVLCKDGAYDRIEYGNIAGVLAGVANLTIVCKFFPLFTAGDGAIHHFYSSTNGARYLLLKDSANQLALRLGETSIGTIALASYVDYWKVGEENTIIVSSTSGDTDIWLNGTKIMDADATAWSVGNPTELYVGSAHWGSQSFHGTIKELLYFDRRLSDQEIADYTSNSIYDYRNHAILDLPLDLENHDPSSVQALDVSVNGLNAQLGDGTTPGTYPTKNTIEAGYNFDGTDDYLDVGDTSADIKTVVLWVKPDSTTEDILDLDAGTHTIEVGAGTVTATGFAAPVIFVNGVLTDGLVADRWQMIVVITATAIDADNVDIGRIAASYYDGDIAMVQMFYKELTPMQIADLYQRGLKKVNKA